MFGLRWYFSDEVIDHTKSHPVIKRPPWLVELGRAHRNSSMSDLLLPLIFENEWY